MENQRVCKICCKTFSNGKAMGRHMRSHLVKLPLPPTSPFPDLSFNSTPAFSSISSYRSVISSHRSVISSLSNSDVDSHSRHYAKRRSKRRRESAIDDDLSSEKDTFPAEDVALCLLMMSADNWEQKTDVKIEEDEEEYLDSDSVEEHVGEEEESVCQRKKCPVKYNCDTYNKVFESYQALGGHKASHKKMNRTKEQLEEVSNGGRENSDCKLVVKNRTFQCPFCVKVFDSGQALGGHKKVHFSQIRRSIIPSSSSEFGTNLFDLNLPPSEYDDDGSQVE